MQPRKHKGILYKTSCYGLGAMQYAKDGESWRNKTKLFLDKLSIYFFNPYDKPFISSLKEDKEERGKWRQWMQEGKYDEVSKIAKKCRNEDLRFCDIVSFGIFHINPEIPTYGSMEEAVTMVRAKKPLFICVENSKSKCPFWLMGMVPHKDYIYGSLDEILEEIRKIDSGERPLDDRWKILKDEYK